MADPLRLDHPVASQNRRDPYRARHARCAARGQQQRDSVGDSGPARDPAVSPELWDGSGRLSATNVLLKTIRTRSWGPHVTGRERPVEFRSAKLATEQTTERRSVAERAPPPPALGFRTQPERRHPAPHRPTPAHAGCAPAETRPRDLRSSFVTLRVYEGIPLTQIGREVGTSVRRIEQHYAGVIANWNGKRVPAERQIRAARRTSGPQMAPSPKAKGVRDSQNPC
jgi:hypothetical protein